MPIPTNLIERQRLWTNASYKLGGWAGDFDLVIEVQQLGRAEAHLIKLEDQLPRIINRQQTNPPELTDENWLPDEAIAISRLWVFGLYEVMRTYRQAVARNERARRPFDALNRVLNTLRSPLAKHQVAGRVTPHVPSPLFNSQTGRIGWLVHDPKTETMQQVLRIELADNLLSAAGKLIGSGEAEAQDRNEQSV